MKQLSLDVSFHRNLYVVANFIFRVSQDRNGTGSRHPELSIRLWGGSSGTGKTTELFCYVMKGMQSNEIHCNFLSCP